MAVGQGLSLIDAELVKAAANNMSPVEMEAEFDVPAAEAYARVKEVLAGRNIWTEIERKQLLLESAFNLKAQIENATIDTSKPKEVEAYVRLLDHIAARLDAANTVNSADLEKVTGAMAKKLLMIYELATERAIEILRSEYPTVFIEDLRAALEQGLSLAADEVED